MVTTSNGTTATAPGTPGSFAVIPPFFTPPPGMVTDWGTGAVDSSCAFIDASRATGTSGTVTLDSVSGDAFAGACDVVLTSGDHVTGSFDAKPCRPFVDGVPGTVTCK